MQPAPAKTEHEPSGEAPTPSLLARLGIIGMAAVEPVLHAALIGEAGRRVSR
jgi:hypothetical protein